MNQLNRPYSILFYSLVIICSNCSTGAHESKGEADIISDDGKIFNNVSLKDSKTYKIDTTQSVFADFLQFHLDENSRGNLLVFNEKTLNLDRFDFDTQKHLQKVVFESDGPNGIGKVIDGFYFINSDSILVASRYDISIANTSGKVIKKYNLAKKQVLGIPKFGPNNPIIFDKSKKVIYTSIVPDVNALKPFENKTFGIMKLNLETGDLDYDAEYPIEYREDAFGPNYLYSYTCPTGSSNRILVSFSGSPDIVNYNLKNQTFFKIKYPYRKSGEIRNGLPSNSDYNKYTKFYITNPSYENCIFDRKNNLYYRIVAHPRSDDEYRDGKHWKRKSLIVMDSTFHKVGEIDIKNENLNFMQVVSTDKGVFVSDFLDEEHLKLVRIDPLK